MLLKKLIKKSFWKVLLDAMEKKNKQKKTTQQQLCVLEFSRVPIRYKRNLFCSPHLLQANFILLLHFYYLFILISFTHDSVPLSCHVLSRRCKVRGVASLKKKRPAQARHCGPEERQPLSPHLSVPPFTACHSCAWTRSGPEDNISVWRLSRAHQRYPWLLKEIHTHTHMGHSKGYMYVFIY